MVAGILANASGVVEHIGYAERTVCGKAFQRQAGF